MRNALHYNANSKYGCRILESMIRENAMQEYLKLLKSDVAVDEYEILIFLKEKGICFIEVAGQYFYEENSGVLSSEKNYVKIRVPQQLLDSNETYKVIFNGFSIH